MSNEQTKMQKSFRQKLVDWISNIYPAGQTRAQQQHRVGSQISFQSRLVLANMLITFLVIAGMGYYVYYRAQQTNTYLTVQLGASVRQQAEAVLQKASIEQVETLNNFFVSLRKDITNFGDSTGRMLAQENQLGNNTYWDATQSLNRLSNGSWDNPAADQGSVFIPASKDLTPSLVTELNTLAQLNFVAPVHLNANPDIVAIYFGGLSGETLYYPNVDLAALVPNDFDVTQRPWYVNASSSQNTDQTAVWSDPYLDAASNGLVITTSIPVYDELGNIRGVSAMDIQLNKITEIVSNIRVGDTGHAFLLGKDKRLIAMPAASYKDFGITPDEFPLGNTLDQVSPDFQDVVNKMSAGESGLTTIKINGIENFVIYQPIPEVGYSLAIVVPSQELQKVASSTSEQIAKSTQNTLLFGGLLVIVLLVFSFFAALVIGNRLMKPLRTLTSTAEEITRGNMNAKASVQGQDEIGLLATAFNRMTAQLREFISTLEFRVAERTRNLELAGEIGRTVSQVRALDVMLKDAAELIRKQFDLYYVQVYLTDPSQTNLILQSGTGAVGAELVNRGHRLPLNTASINGRAALEKHSVVISNTAESSTFKSNPLLPDTRSEMAVPLMIGDRVVGVLDMQSEIPGSLNQDVLSAFEALAGQLAIAIQNANFLAETEQARAEVESQAQRLSRANWTDYLDAIHKPEETGFVFEQNKVTPLTQTREASDNALTAPISVTGETLGNLIVEMEGGSPIARTEELVNAVAQQVAQQIESLRLLDSAERYRAEAEQASRRITREGWQAYAANADESLSYVYDLKEVRTPSGNEDRQVEESGYTLPLKVRDETVGKLVVQGLDAGDSESTALVNAVAERLGAHIESLRQFDQAQSALSQTEKLSDASLRFAQSANLQELLTVTVETLGIPVINRSLLGVFNYNSAHEMEDLVIVANWWNGSGHEPSEIGRRYTLETLNALPFLMSTTPVFSNDTFNDERIIGVSLQLVKSQNIRSMAVLPLYLGSHQIGVVFLESEETHSFSQSDIRLFTAMAPQIATVLENRRQFERAQKQAERESTLNVISQKIQGATTVEAVLQIAARELGHALGAPMTVAQLSMKDKN